MRVTIRAKVAQAMTVTPTTARELATRAGVTYRQCVDALMHLFLSDRVEREGRRRKALWRAQTEAERAIGERRRANEMSFLADEE